MSGASTIALTGGSSGGAGAAAGNVVLNANLTATNSATITAGTGSANSGTITQAAGVVTNAPAVDLESHNGDIGTVAIPIAITATNLTVNGNGSATNNAFVTDSTGVTLSASSGNTFQLSAGGAITVAGTLTATNTTLTSTAGNGAINLNANIAGGVGSVNLTAYGSGAINETSGDSITTGTLTLASTSGNIGTGAGGAVKTTATTISASTTGNVNLSDSNAGVTTLVGPNTGNNYTLAMSNNAGSIALGNAGNPETLNGANAVTLTAGFSWLNSQRHCWQLDHHGHTVTYRWHRRYRYRWEPDRN